jgi:hypothetical protein
MQAADQKIHRAKPLIFRPSDQPTGCGFYPAIGRSVAWLTTADAKTCAILRSIARLVVAIFRQWIHPKAEQRALRRCRRRCAQRASRPIHLARIMVQRPRQIARVPPQTLQSNCLRSVAKCPIAAQCNSDDRGATSAQDSTIAKCLAPIFVGRGAFDRYS